MEFFRALIDTDKYFFTMFNSQLTHPWLDVIFPALTDLHRSTFLTFYVLPAFLVLWLVWNRLKCVKTLLGIVVAVGLADSASYHLIKNNVRRERPEKAMANVELRTHSHSGYSFPSNHAANIFAGAFIVRYMYPQLRSLAYIIAFLVAYSRIYVGVHFPLDVMAGGIIGYLSGLITITLGLKVQPESWKYDPPDFAKN